MAVTSVLEIGLKRQEVPKSVPTDVRTYLVFALDAQSPQSLLMGEEENDGISYEELAQSYTVMYENWLNVVKTNENL